MECLRVFHKLDVKIFLFAVALLNDVWLGQCCKKCTTGSGDVNWRKKRSTSDPTRMSKTQFLLRNGTTFSIALDENPCVFETYDLDYDGIITKEELEDKLGDKKETRDLFAFIDTMDDDGEISFNEFCAAIPTLIEECKGCCYV